MKRVLLSATLGAVLLGSAITAVLATGSTMVLPPNWHIHDGQTQLGSPHKGVAFFPAILGEDLTTYLADPARCPNATDKAFLPSGQQGMVLRAGICETSTETIHLRTVPLGTSGPEGWSLITSTAEPGWVTYYLVTRR